MASIQATKAGYEVCWRYGGKPFHQTVGVAKDDADALDKANAARGRVENTIRGLKDGFLRLPDGADYATTRRFIFTGGQKPQPDVIATPTAGLTLADLFSRYVASKPSNEPNTLVTEAVHRGHLLRILGAGQEVDALTFSDIQTYADKRKPGYRQGDKAWKPAGPETITKELKTLSKMWMWGTHRGLVTKPKPWQLKNLDLGRATPWERFRDFDEVTEIIQAGGISDQEVTRFWKSLYLRGHDVDDLLAWVRDHASAPFVYPLFVLCALTGCRRSEAVRALKRDFNFTKGLVELREKKRDHTQEYTTRIVPMHPTLVAVMKAWFADHPGGQYAIADEHGRPIPLRSRKLDRAFEITLRDGKWKVMRGWHTLRHSFASILASKGIDQRIINKFMGHLDDRTVARYQHLYKETGHAAVMTLLS